MPRPMSLEECQKFEALARAFCELRAEYRRRKENGSLGQDLDARMRQALNALDLRLDRLKNRNELAQIRAERAEELVPAGADTARRAAW